MTTQTVRRLLRVVGKQGARMWMAELLFWKNKKRVRKDYNSGTSRSLRGLMSKLGGSKGC